ncbi:MAG: hypothetical protein LBI42_05315 [Chitinispirillales bacterium]|jgi:hypothetical protein|nr:hypothetical protein [Chitinispirillales bacterium]
MLKETITRSFLALTCAAAFTFVAAQFPWEIESTPESSFGSESSSESSFNSDFSGSSSESFQPAVEPEAVTAPVAPAAEKPARRASAGASGDQVTCPVCVSKKLKKNQFVDYDNRRIYVCSASCIGRVKRNPEKFIEKLENRGEGVEKL